MRHIDQANPARRRHRRRAIIATVVAVPVLGFGGVAAAAAAGWLPDAVLARFGALIERSDSQVAINSDQAVLVAQAGLGDRRVEVWSAPADPQPQCVYLRFVWGAPGAETAENGPVGCVEAVWPTAADLSATPAADLVGWLDVTPVGPQELWPADGPALTAITGVVDRSVGSLDIAFADGRAATVDVPGAQGWFAVMLAEDLARPIGCGVGVNPVASVTLRDPTGAELAVLANPTGVELSGLVATPSGAPC
jgi:hypothetical protein